jgi:hypothetical protein
MDTIDEPLAPDRGHRTVRPSSDDVAPDVVIAAPLRRLLSFLGTPDDAS